MKRMLRSLRPHMGMVLLCALCVLLANALEIAKPALLARAIDKHIALGEPGLTQTACLYLFAALFGALFAYAQALLVETVCQRVLHGVRLSVFDHILHMPMRALRAFGSGRLITRATNDVETLAEFYSDVLVHLFRDVVLLLFIVGTMLYLDVRLALVSFCVLPLIAGITVFVRARLRRNFVEMKRLIGSINAFFAENIAGMQIVQAFGRQRMKQKKFFALNTEYHRTTLVQVNMNTILRPSMEVINSLAIALLLWHGANRLLLRIPSAPALEIGVLYAFTDYIKRFFDPINDMAEKFTTVESAIVSAERIDALLSDPQTEDLTAGTHEGPVMGRIVFDHVWFAYEGDDYVLRDVSFTVEPGDKVAFVGRTGAGKSTIIHLLSGLYAPQRGEITIDDVPIDQWKLGALRRGISVVLQDVFLFAGTVADNIRIFEDMPDTRIEASLEAALADQFIARLPGGMHAPLGERGATLSSGERQLLSFARAIAHDPAILVLDEATASVDTQTELRIQESILRISDTRTAVFIAHRLSTIQRCDCIYVIEDGRIAEQGTHASLIALGGQYADMVHTSI